MVATLLAAAAIQLNRATAALAETIGMPCTFPGKEIGLISGDQQRCSSVNGRFKKDIVVRDQG